MLLAILQALSAIYFRRSCVLAFLLAVGAIQNFAVPQHHPAFWMALEPATMLLRIVLAGIVIGRLAPNREGVYMILGGLCIALFATDQTWEIPMQPNLWWSTFMRWRQDVFVVMAVSLLSCCLYRRWSRRAAGARDEWFLAAYFTDYAAVGYIPAADLPAWLSVNNVHNVAIGSLLVAFLAHSKVVENRSKKRERRHNR